MSPEHVLFLLFLPKGVHVERADVCELVGDKVGHVAPGGFEESVGVGECGNRRGRNVRSVSHTCGARVRGVGGVGGESAEGRRRL